VSRVNPRAEVGTPRIRSERSSPVPSRPRDAEVDITNPTVREIVREWPCHFSRHVPETEDAA